MHQVAGKLGLAGVGLLGLSLVVFSWLNPNFHPLDDYVSKLGAAGQPHALWWNLIGFGAVGVLSAGFGFTYGLIMRDRWVSILLCLFGIGFAATGVPIDLANERSPVSKAHVVAICLGLAAWLFALARISHQPALGQAAHRSAQIAAMMLVVPIVGLGIGLWSMPVTHRLVFVVVFAWQAFISIGLLREQSKAPLANEGVEVIKS